MIYPQRSLAEVPAVTTDQMREVDRLMISEAGISLPQMMENAGRSLAALVIDLHGPATVTVVAGSGGNGGGGLVAARHLRNRGVEVSVTMAKTSLSPVAQLQLDIVHKMGITVDDDPRESEVIADALIGYGLQGDPRERTAELMKWVNRSSAKVVSLDVPSGLDATTGLAYDPCVTADATLTIALPKAGLAASDTVGDLYLTDISVPAAVYEAIGIEVPPDLFGAGQVLALT